jgi:hypothetical protein
MAGSGRLARGSATAVWTTQRDILPEAGASIGAELRVVKWPSDWGVVRNEQRHLCYLRVEEGRDQRLVVLCEAESGRAVWIGRIEDAENEHPWKPAAVVGSHASAIGWSRRALAGGCVDHREILCKTHEPHSSIDVPALSGLAHPSEFCQPHRASN